MRFLGIDLAWGEGSATRAANCSGVVALDSHGKILDAGWVLGLDATVSWMEQWSPEPSLAFVDAPLVVTNASGPRPCDREVGQRFGRYWVSANSINLASPRQAGVHLRERLSDGGWNYDDGIDGPPTAGRTVSECYPYTTLVGAAEFAFRPHRPPYKRKPKGQSMREFWPVRLQAWDAIVAKLDRLVDADPPLDLDSHELTQALRTTPLAGKAAAYKQAEDLLDAVICAWTAALWWRHGPASCSPLGAPTATAAERPLTATIIAPITEAEGGVDSGPAS